MATYNPLTGKRMLTIPGATPPAPAPTGLTAEQQKLKAGITAGNAGAAVNIQAGNNVEGLSSGNIVTIDGQEYNLGARRSQDGLSTPKAPPMIRTTSGTDKSAALLSAGKSGVTNNLAGGRTDNLPGVTKYAGQDQTAGGIKYGNNKAGIDLLNKQSMDQAPMEGVYSATFSCNWNSNNILI